MVVTRRETTMTMDPYSASFCYLKFETRVGSAITCPNAARLLRIKRSVSNQPPLKSSSSRAGRRLDACVGACGAAVASRTLRVVDVVALHGAGMVSGDRRDSRRVGVAAPLGDAHSPVVRPLRLENSV